MDKTPSRYHPERWQIQLIAAGAALALLISLGALFLSYSNSKSIADERKAFVQHVIEFEQALSTQQQASIEQSNWASTHQSSQDSQQATVVKQISSIISMEDTNAGDTKSRLGTLEARAGLERSPDVQPGYLIAFSPNLSTSQDKVWLTQVRRCVEFVSTPYQVQQSQKYTSSSSKTTRRYLFLGFQNDGQGSADQILLQSLLWKNRPGRENPVDQILPAEGELEFGPVNSTNAGCKQVWLLLVDAWSVSTQEPGIDRGNFEMICANYRLVGTNGQVVKDASTHCLFPDATVEGRYQYLFEPGLITTLQPLSIQTTTTPKTNP